MKRNLCFPDESTIQHEILAYLNEHPDAEDTLKGILEWWLVDRKIKYQKAVVEKVLDRLVRDGYIHAEKGGSAEGDEKDKGYEKRNYPRFRINKTRTVEIRQFLERKIDDR